MSASQSWKIGVKNLGFYIFKNLKNREVQVLGYLFVVQFSVQVTLNLIF